MLHSSEGGLNGGMASAAAEDRESLRLRQSKSRAALSARTSAIAEATLCHYGLRGQLPVVCRCAIACAQEDRVPVSELETLPCTPWSVGVDEMTSTGGRLRVIDDLANCVSGLTRGAPCERGAGCDSPACQLTAGGSGLGGSASSGSGDAPGVGARSFTTSRFLSSSPP